MDAAIAGHGEVVLVAGEPGVRHQSLTIGTTAHFVRLAVKVALLPKCRRKR